jgi:predicted MPP superfamily phosphohydrolase
MNGKISRRKFLSCSLLASPAVLGADACIIEPEWLRIKTVRLADKPTHRIVHVTDIHHKGDCPYLETVINTINRLSPDAVCFTGDLIEKSAYLPEALAFMRNIKAPIYGVPGNHDYWSKCDFDLIEECFDNSGGAWLMDKQVRSHDGQLHFTGATCLNWAKKVHAPQPSGKNIMLMHYPLFVEKLTPHKFDLVLAGHSHGGQVRIPFLGPLIVPFWVGRYDMGLYQTDSGPLYVNPGIGYVATSIRFNCRPELTVFEV